MQDYIDLIKQTNQALKEIQSYKTNQEKINYIENNFELFFNFKNEIHTILKLYQFKEPSDNVQNEISEELKQTIIQILSIKNIFEYDSDEMSYFKYIKSNILEALSQNEGYFAYNLQSEKSMDNTKSAILYLKDRDEYLKAIDEYNLLDEDGMIESSANSYINNKYEQNMFGHALIQLNNNFGNLSKEDITSLISEIDSSSYVQDLANNINNDNFYDKNLLYQYAKTVLKLKSIFTPDQISNDMFVKLFWDGKIKDSKNIKNIAENISIGNVYNMLSNSTQNAEYEFLYDLSKHFQSIGMSNKNISSIVSIMLSKGLGSYSIAEFLARIDVPETKENFINGEFFEQFPWVAEGDVFEKLKEEEKSIEEARRPFLPSEYYIKKLSRLGIGANANFRRNLFTLIKTDYYTEDEKQDIIKTLKEHNLYSKYIVDEDIDFNSNDKIMEKIVKSYYSGKTIPNNIAIAVIKKLMKENDPKNLTTDRVMLESAVQSIVSNHLSENGVEIGNKVFFGDGHNINSGYYSRAQKCIWIDNNLIHEFITNDNIENKIQLFRTMFHEIRHAIQFKNIEQGNIDYLTYSFIKESVIEDYDEDFYNSNYKSIYTESDARKEEILGTLEFLNSLDSNLMDTTKNKMIEDFIEETEEHTIYKDADKKMSIGKNNMKINISEYLGHLIPLNPQILEEFPILSVEYNPDGSQKDIKTLMMEFSNKNYEQQTEYTRMYSIYYALINQKMQETEEIDIELKNQIDNFMNKQPELISLEDMQNYYKEVPKEEFRKTYSRLISLTRNNTTIEKSTKEGVESYDNNAR